MDLQTRLLAAIEEYNRYRAPEAQARLVTLDVHGAWVEFTGSFCRTCGAYDWYEDLLWILRDHGIKAKIQALEEFLGGARVRFQWEP